MAREFAFQFRSIVRDFTRRCRRDNPEEAASTKFRAISNRMPGTKRDLNGLSRANNSSEFPGERTREPEERERERSASGRCDCDPAAEVARRRGQEETEGRLRRKPRTGTGNRNEKLVPGNFIGAKGRRGEREEDGGG